MKKLGQYIRLVRTQRGMSLMKFAQRLNLNYGVVQKMEAGAIKYYPDKPTLMQIASVLEVEFSQLVDLIYEFSTTMTPPTSLSEKGMEVSILSWTYLPEILNSKKIPVDVSAPTVVTGRRDMPLFALMMETSHAAPILPAGSIAIIDPFTIVSGAPILVWFPETRRANIYRQEVLERHTVLHSLDPSMPSAILDVNMRRSVIGSIIEIRFPTLATD